MSNLSGIEELTNLTRLELHANMISDGSLLRTTTSSQE